MLVQSFDEVRIQSPIYSTLVLVIPLMGLTGCVPQHVKDVEWCRDLEVAKTLVDARGKANLTTVMAKNECASKLLEAKKAAEGKASTPPSSATKQTTKRPGK